MYSIHMFEALQEWQMSFAIFAGVFLQGFFVLGHRCKLVIEENNFHELVQVLLDPLRHGSIRGNKSQGIFKRRKSGR